MTRPLKPFELPAPEPGRYLGRAERIEEWDLEDAELAQDTDCTDCPHLDHGRDECPHCPCAPGEGSDE